MKVCKKLCKVFTIIGMIGVPLTIIIAMLVVSISLLVGGAIDGVNEASSSIDTYTESAVGVFAVFAVLLVPVIVLSLVFGSITLKNLRNNKKSFFVGIMNILFVSNVSGILYMVWNPNRS